MVTAVAMVVAILFFVVGLAGSVLPALPGPILIWVGMLLYGVLTKFTTLHFLFFLGQALAVVLVYVTDYWAGMVGVKRFGGSRYALWGSFIGTLLGLFILGPAGIIFGPFAGAVAGELLNKQQLPVALRAGIGTIVGLLGGVVVKLTIGMGMIIWFFWAIGGK